MKFKSETKTKNSLIKGPVALSQTFYYSQGGTIDYRIHAGWAHHGQLLYRRM